MSSHAAARDKRDFMNNTSTRKTLTAFPDSAWVISCLLWRAATLLAGIRAGEDNLCRLPSRLFKASSGLIDRSEAQGLVRLTVAGAAQVEPCRASDVAFLLPVELRHVNHTASTNMVDFSNQAFTYLKMISYARPNAD